MLDISISIASSLLDTLLGAGSGLMTMVVNAVGGMTGLNISL